MNESHIAKISAELNLRPQQVKATAALLADGGTVPFIARYRKEATGMLDEVAIASIRDRLLELHELDQRREAILKSLSERNLLTDELKSSVESAQSLTALEDIYLPYRPKRRTRAMIAKERGLEPLADLLFNNQRGADPLAEAQAFLNPENGVPTLEEALAGARDIIAERISEDPVARPKTRELFAKKSTVKSKVVKGKEEEGAKFKDYFDWHEPITNIPSHRLLAIRRGEAESILYLRMTPPEEEALSLLESLFVQAATPAGNQIKLAAHDSYKRLLGPSLEAELRLETKKKADQAAIQVFAQNLRELLLASPLGQKNVLAIDPGFRTGCKVVCLDRQGKLLHNDVVYPGQSDSQAGQAAQRLQKLLAHFQIEAIAVGNGTGGRETETFLRKLGLPASIPIVMVNESGASIYSASEAAREEFPDHDLTVRGAVSIGRRLMDPLAELVKIDPKSIGVGQYQHDVDPFALKRSLDDVVMSCVNSVGVELNTASRQLLTYVSGLGSQLASNIVQHRDQHGPFRSRQDLKKVARLGPKAFEQAAGFLRIHDAENPLDASAVHPESYPVIDAMTRDLNCSVRDLMANASLRRQINLPKYVTEQTGLPTLNDILAEMAKPGRDPRRQFEPVRFLEGIEKIEDLKPGQKLTGIVTNVTAFGAFVDVGVHQDGLVHVSQLADRFVKDPAEVVKVQQKVQVTVLDIDLPRKRIALSMRANPEIPSSPREASRQSPAQPRSKTPPQSQSRNAPPAADWFTEALQRSKK